MSKINEGFKVDKSEYKKIYDDENYLLVVPLTHTASCKYGANTKWCTTKKDDDSDFEEHVTMGVLAYLIIKDPTIYNKMSSQKYGLYRSNGYELKDLIIYDELNNEHLNGIKYLKNEFDKAGRDSDGIKIIDIYNKHYQENSIGFMMNRPEKINEDLSIESLKPLCNRMVIAKKGGFAQLNKSSIIYYTKGGKFVASDALKNNGIQVPFKIGDSIHELVKWCVENKIKTDDIGRDRSRKNLKEEDGEVKLSPGRQKVVDAYVKEPTLFNLTMLVMNGLYTDEMLELHTSGDTWSERNFSLDVDGRKGTITIEFESDDEFSEFFTDGGTDYYDLYHVKHNQPDYEYYRDSAWSDVDEENYHLNTISDNGNLIKMAKHLIDNGFNIDTEVYEKAVKHGENGTVGYNTNDDLMQAVSSILRLSFKTEERNLAEEYVERTTNAYAIGFNNEVNKAYQEWLNYGEAALGLVEVDTLEEYTVDMSQLFKYLIRPSHRGFTLQDTIEKSRPLRDNLGSGAELFSMGEAKYEYSDDAEWEGYNNFVNDWVNDFINDFSDKYELELSEKNADLKLLSRYDIDVNYVLEYMISDTNFGGGTVTSYEIDKIKKLIPKTHVRMVAGTDRPFYYLGYSFNESSHIILIKDKGDSSQRWNYGRFKSHLVTAEDIIKLLTQTNLELNETHSIIRRNLSEQGPEIMEQYYSMMNQLIKHYGEDGVNLIGSPAKIVIGKDTVKLDGERMIMMVSGKRSIVKIEDYSTDNNGIVYPSIKYITDKIPKSKKEKIVKSNNKGYKDGEFMKASQTFWDSIKVDEGSVKRKGEPVLKAYALGDGRITIGWGHTGALSKPTPKIGDVITKPQAQKYLQNDATEAANCVRRFLGEWKKEGLVKDNHMITQNMFDVLVSLAFNAGCQGLRTSDFIKMVKTRKYESAAILLPKDTTMINGKFSKGLTSRRKRESQLFLK